MTDISWDFARCISTDLYEVEFVVIFVIGAKYKIDDVESGNNGVRLCARHMIIKLMFF